MRKFLGSTLLALLLVAAVALGAHAWKGGVGGAMPIKEAVDTAEIGDYFVVEGVVTESKHGEFYRIRDDSGELVIYIPDFLRRDKGVPVVGERIRVAGKFDQKKLERSKQGMRVVSLHRLGVESGHAGEAAAPGATATLPTRTASPPAAPHDDGTGQRVYRPTATEAFKLRAKAAREDLDAARKDMIEANNAYARALRDAGTASKVDPAIKARNEAAERRVATAREKAAALAAEGRASGVDENVVDTWERMTAGE